MLTQNSSKFLRCDIFSIFSIMLFPMSRTLSFSCTPTDTSYWLALIARTWVQPGMTYIFLQSLDLRQPVVTEIKLL